MARGQRKTIEENISEREKVIESLKARLKSEQRELDELNKEKRDQDFQALYSMLEKANMSASDAADVINRYLEDGQEGSQEDWQEHQ